jgi:ABC-type sugar transport system ATPase subunit
MNLFDGVIEGEQGKMRLRTAAVAIDLPPLTAQRIEQSGYERCILGIRPENIALVPQGQGHCDVRVGVTENIGAEYLVYIFLDGAQIVVRTSRPPESEQAGLLFDPEKTHLFASQR